MELCPAVANLDEDPALEIVTVTGCQSIAIFDLEVPQRAVSTLRTWEGWIRLFGAPGKMCLSGHGLISSAGSKVLHSSYGSIIAVHANPYRERHTEPWGG